MERTYKSGYPRCPPERFIKYLPSHLVHVRWDLWWTKIGIVVPFELIQLSDTIIVHGIEHDNPHYMVSRIACT